LALVLDVHTDHHHATLAIAAPVALEHRRLLVARRIAPRRPEVHDDDLAPVRGELERRALERGQREAGSRPPDERRGDVARAHPEPVGEQREHRDGRERDQPAPETLHALLCRSGRMARSAPRVSTSPPIQIQLTRRLTWSLTVACEPSRAKSPRTR